MSRNASASRVAGVAGLLLLLAACAEEEPAPLVCPEGQVADGAGGCRVPDDTCAPDVPGSILARCTAEHRSCFEPGNGARCGPCVNGWVEDDGACRERRSCADLACATEGRSCLEGGERADARCGDCLPATEALDGACVPHTCEPDAPASLAAACAAERRACIEEEGAEARCGACWAGFADRAGACERVRTCADLGCAAALRSCTPEAGATDASCGGCRAGHVERGGACVPQPDATCAEAPAEGSILAACAAERRACDGTGSPARCGGCLDGFVEDDQLGCVARVTCAELACEDRHRACVETPNGRCADCLAGWVEEPSDRSCRPVRTCDGLTCPAGEECLGPGAHEDARCVIACGPNALWSGTRCEPCPPCDAAGEDGRWPAPTRAGACICRTEPGHFYSTAGDVGSFPCDADGDGWLRESARLALESTDPALAGNARCDLRTVDRFVLVNEAGDERQVVLQAPLPLYESDRNDDPALLRIHWATKSLPGWGPDGGPPEARELNRLTKLCHDPRTDYNDNGVADVDEWYGHPRGPTVRADQAPFNELSYFAELHTGAWEPGTGGPHGRYVIRERRRATAPAGPVRVEHVPLAYAEGDGSYWRSCDVDRDPAFGVVTPAVGLDFAVHSDPDPAFSGMHHHGQFKCLVFENEPAPGAPQEWTAAAAAARGFRLQRCRAAGPPVAPSGTNPALPDVACTAVAAAEIRPGDVAWGAVPYDDYGPHLPGASYRGGCVNACIAALPGCPGYDLGPRAVACEHDPADFGKFVACHAWEICDGKDNDGNGLEDDGNPEGGQPCDTGALGICAAGTTNCRGGVVHCDQDEPARTETCNGLDDDCDGTVDPTFPEDGQACTVDGLAGICATGVWTCPAGDLVCAQTVFPEASETCGNGADDDCNGKVDDGENAVGCLDYHLDEDGDGWGVATSKKCLCAPDPASNHDAIPKNAAGVARTTPYKWDCCDADDRARPGAATYYRTASACNSYDYDCTGQGEPQYPSHTVAGCGTCCFLSLCCCDARTGWANAVPQCGTQGTWYVDDCTGWSGCNQVGEQRWAYCR